MSAPNSSHTPQIPRLINMFTATDATHHIALMLYEDGNLRAHIPGEMISARFQ
jgi:hypothetical protein